MPQDLLAALDLGSNTFRLILARPDRGRLDPSSRRVWQEIPRISEGLAPGRKLGEAGKRRAWKVLTGFKKVIDENRPAGILAGGTMAFREAADGAEFLAEAGRLLGGRAIILSGPEEARLSAIGVLSGLAPVPESGLIFDIGGRSTELIRTRGTEILSVDSLPLGVVGLTEAHIQNDPPSAAEIEALAESVRKALQAIERSDLSSDTVLVGTAGTVTTVAAMLLDLAVYDPAKINNQSFDRAKIGSLLSRLSTMTTAARAAWPGLHPGRADVIVAGLVEVVELMDHLGRGRLVVSDNSLLEGLWLAAAGLVDIPRVYITEVAP